MLCLFVPICLCAVKRQMRERVWARASTNSWKLTCVWLCRFLLLSNIKHYSRNNVHAGHGRLGDALNRADWDHRPLPTATAQLCTMKNWIFFFKVTPHTLAINTMLIKELYSNWNEQQINNAIVSILFHSSRTSMNANKSTAIEWRSGCRTKQRCISL